MLGSQLTNAYSLWSEFSKAKFELYRVTMLSEDTYLPRGIKEMIAVIIAKAYACNYCLEHHFSAMKEYGISYDLASEIRQDYKSSSLEEKLKALLSFCEKFSLTVNEVDDLGYSDLMKQGWTKEEIFEAIVVSSELVSIIKFTSALGLKYEYDQETTVSSRTPIQR